MLEILPLSRNIVQNWMTLYNINIFGRKAIVQTSSNYYKLAVTSQPLFELRLISKSMTSFNCLKVLSKISQIFGVRGGKIGREEKGEVHSAVIAGMGHSVFAFI